MSAKKSTLVGGFFARVGDGGGVLFLTWLLGGESISVRAMRSPILGSPRRGAKGSVYAK